MSEDRAVTRIDLAGNIEGYRVRHLPKKIEDRGEGITLTKSAKLAAYLEVRVDGHQYLVPAEDNEGKTLDIVLDEGQDPTPDVIRTINAKLETQHPMCERREFVEITSPAFGGSKKKVKKYRLKR